MRYLSSVIMGVPLSKFQNSSVTSIELREELQKLINEVIDLLKHKNRI